MTLQEIKQEVIKLNPYDVVDVDMDSFDPYTYLNLPQNLRDELDKLTITEQDEFSEWESELLDRLRLDGKKIGWTV